MRKLLCLEHWYRFVYVHHRHWTWVLLLARWRRRHRTIWRC